VQSDWLSCRGPSTIDAQVTHEPPAPLPPSDPPAPPEPPTPVADETDALEEATEFATVDDAVADAPPPPSDELPPDDAVDVDDAGLDVSAPVDALGEAVLLLPPAPLPRRSANVGSFAELSHPIKTTAKSNHVHRMPNSVTHPTASRD
jgi:hypothetical protein